MECIRFRWFLTAAAIASACIREPPPPRVDAGPQEELTLAKVGTDPAPVVGDAFDLRVVLVDPSGARDTDGTPIPTRVAGREVQWSLVEGAGTFEQGSTTTDADGLSVNRFQPTASFTGSLRLKADVGGAHNHADWMLNVVPGVRHVRIIPNTPLVTLTDTATASTAAVTGIVGTHVTLQVQVTEELGAVESPVTSVPVSFSFVTSIAGTSLTPSGPIPTSSDGIASVDLALGSTVGAYRVLATAPGNLSATFDVHVTTQPVPCRLTSQCPANYICISGTCQTTGDPHSCEGCPIGYACMSGQCTPIHDGCVDPSICPSGYTCDSSNQCVPDEPQCSDTMPCPGDAVCSGGVCYPSDGQTLNVTGHWYTAHDFDVHAALPEWMHSSSERTAILESILEGAVPGLPRPVSTFLGGLGQYYVPVWAPTVVYLVEHLDTIFANLRARGEMDLTAVGGPAVLYGTENWDQFVFYLLSQCGQNVGRVDPAHPPPCAEVDVYTSDLAQANFATTVHPFTARLMDDELLVDRRQVDLQLAGIIEYLINQVVWRASGYPSLQGPPGHPEEGALYNLVDCKGLSQLVLAVGIPLDITPMCQAFIASVADDLAQQLSNIVINTNALSFTGQATATPQVGSNTYANRLGQTTYETIDPPDGEWNAELVNLLSNVPGRWRAARTPWQ